MTVTKVENDYKDVTIEWMKQATPNSHQVKDRNYFETNDGKRFYVDEKNIVLDYSSDEKEIALWLENTLGGELYMLPRINTPDGIKTADYLFREEYWDLKKMKILGKRTVDNRLNRQQKQANNFIFDISNNVASNEEIIQQITDIYSSKDRKWVDKIILMRDKRLIKVYERKRD